MILADVLSGLVETDTDLLLAINGWRAEWADYFMYAFSGKWIWVPLYAAILYVIVRNLHWKVAIGCVVAIALTIVFADQVGATVIRPVVCRLRPANLENPVSEFVQIVNGYRGGRYVLFPFLFGSTLSRRLAGRCFCGLCRCFSLLLAFQSAV